MKCFIGDLHCSFLCSQLLCSCIDLYRSVPFFKYLLLFAFLGSLFLVLLLLRSPIKTACLKSEVPLFFAAFTRPWPLSSLDALATTMNHAPTFPAQLKQHHLWLMPTCFGPCSSSLNIDSNWFKMEALQHQLCSFDLNDSSSTGDLD